jgi:uncharacterized protein (DUF779 family)
MQHNSISIDNEAIEWSKASQVCSDGVAPYIFPEGDWAMGGDKLSLASHKA